MLAQQTGGSIVTITAALASNPIRGVTASVSMITKGGLETITHHLAMEYAKDNIRVNAVAPGVVYTPLHKDTPQDVMRGLSPMGRPSTVKDITDAVLYLTDAATVTGDILYVDGGPIPAAGNHFERNSDNDATLRHPRRPLAQLGIHLPDSPDAHSVLRAGGADRKSTVSKRNARHSGHAAKVVGRRRAEPRRESRT